jgi:protease-4
VHTDGVGTTALSGELRLDRPMGDASKDLLQQGIQRTYDDFIARVSKARKRPVEAIDAVAQGRVWAGADAKRIGLVDELGGTGAAIEAAAKLAKLGDDYEVEYFDAQASLGDAFGLRIRVGLARIVAPLLPQGTFPAIPPMLSPLLAEAQRLARLKDPGSLYAYCLACSID